MKTVGLFEAKAKLSEICQRVQSTGESMRITRRGKAVAVISPPVDETGSGSVWDARTRLERKQGAFVDDFELPARVLDERTLANPLE